MPRTGGGRSSKQDLDEKKDHPRSDGSWRGDQNAKDKERFEDPQDIQSRGPRPSHKAGGNKGGDKSRGDDNQGNQAPTDNTRPGGNRTKGGHHNQGQVDHN